MHIRSLVIAIGVDVAVNNMNVVWIAMENTTMGSYQATKCNFV